MGCRLRVSVESRRGHLSITAWLRDHHQYIALSLPRCHRVVPLALPRHARIVASASRLRHRVVPSASRRHARIVASASRLRHHLSRTRKKRFPDQLELLGVVIKGPSRYAGSISTMLSYGAGRPRLPPRPRCLFGARVLTGRRNG